MARRKPLSELSPAYRRRIERAEARGLSRSAARGHKAEAQEKRERREEYRERFGASPERMARLRRQVFDHINSELDRVGTKGFFNSRILRDNLRQVSAEALEKLLEEDGASLKAGASMSYESMVEADEDFANDAGINPRWYGSKAGAFARAA